MASATGNTPRRNRIAYQIIARFLSAFGSTANSFHSFRSRSFFSKGGFSLSVNGACFDCGVYNGRRCSQSKDIRRWAYCCVAELLVRPAELGPATSCLEVRFRQSPKSHEIPRKAEVSTVFKDDVPKLPIHNSRSLSSHIRCHNNYDILIYEPASI